MVLKGQLMVAYSKQTNAHRHTLYADCYKTNLYQSPGLVRASEGHTGERWLRLHVLWCWNCFFRAVVVYQDKVNHCGVKQLTELLFDRNQPVCWAHDCKACYHHKNGEKSSWSHSPWVVQGRSWVMGKGIYSCDSTVGRHLQAQWCCLTHFLFSPRSLSSVHGKIIYKALFGALWFNQI